MQTPVTTRLETTVFFGVLVAMVGCATVSPAWRPLLQEPLSAAEHAGADAVVLSEECRVVLTEGRSFAYGFTLEKNIRLQVLTPGGRHFGRVAVPIDPWTTLDLLVGRSYAPTAPGTATDEMATLPNEVALFEMVQSGTLYSDSKLAVIDIPGADVGRVVEYTVRYRSESPFGLAPWVFGGELPTLESRYTVTAAKDWEVRSHYAVAGETQTLPASVQESETHNTWTWILKGLPVHTDEPLSPPAVKRARRLRLVIKPRPLDGRMALTTWSEVGRFYRHLTHGLDQPPAQALLDFADEHGTVQHDELPMLLYRFVRDRIRYVSMSEGIGALRPHAADLVYRSKLGDCKDMATLLLSLYKHFRVEAAPALVATRDASGPAPEAPALSGFNHLIVALRRAETPAYLFLDPTARSTPFGSIPWEIQGSRALVIPRQGDAELITVPIDTVERNVEEVRWRIAGGNAELTIRATGIDAQQWTEIAAGANATERLREILTANYARGFTRPRVTDIEVSRRLIERHDEFRLTARVQALDLRLDAAGRYFYPLGRFLTSNPSWGSTHQRTTPIRLGFPRRLVTRVEVPIGAQTVVERSPVRLPWESDLASYELVRSIDANRLEVARILTIKQSEAATRQLGDLRELDRITREDARDAIIIRHGGSSQ